MNTGEKQLSDLPKTAHKTDMVTKYECVKFDCSAVADVDHYHGDETSLDQGSIPDIDHLYDLNTVGIRIMLDEYWFNILANYGLFVAQLVPDYSSPGNDLEIVRDMYFEHLKYTRKLRQYGPQ